MQYLAEKSLPLRESANHETIGDPRNGNFLGLAELLAKFDPVMAEHLAKVNSNTLSDPYLSKTIQNELINLLSQKIITEILDHLHSIILDCTSDVSHSEQRTVIGRFVNPKSAEVKEHFIGFVNNCETSAASSTEVVVEVLRKQYFYYGLPLPGIWQCS